MKLPSKILRAAMLFQAKNSIRYYLNGVAVTNKHVMATDGCAAVMMEHGQRIRSSGIIIRFCHKIPAKAVTTRINLLGKRSYAEHIGAFGEMVSVGAIELISEKYPDVKRVMDDAYSDYDGDNEKVAIQAKYLALIDKAFCGPRDFCHVSIMYRAHNQSVGVEMHNEHIVAEFGNSRICIMPAKI